MTDRRRLPNRRKCETFAFEHDGYAYAATVSRFECRAVAELFLNYAKTGTAIETHAHDAAVTVSLALQYGVPLDVLRHAVKRNANGSAAGPIGAVLDKIAGLGGGDA